MATMAVAEVTMVTATVAFEILPVRVVAALVAVADEAT